MLSILRPDGPPVNWFQPFLFHLCVPLGYLAYNQAMTTQSPVTLQTLRQWRAQKKPFAVLTAYDFPMARILAAAGVPVLLVGDSAANVVLGEDSTTKITVDFLVTITRAVRRGAPDALLMGDMPAGSYPNPETAVKNARRFIHEAGANVLKLELNAAEAPIVKALAADGIVVCAHLGLLPQRAAQMGGFKAQGRTRAEAQRIVSEAKTLVDAGAQMILLEAVPNEVSAAVSQAVDVPIIGCGGGPACDGHVVVTPDMLGFAEHPAKFVEVLTDVPSLISGAARRYVSAIESREYPAPRHEYRMKQE